MSTSRARSWYYQALQSWGTYSIEARFVGIYQTGFGMAKRRRGRSTAAIDDHVGVRIRERRVMLGLTQQQLAEVIGVTYQQEHKYERGINRVSAGRLFETARVLNVPVGYFYEGIGEEGIRPVAQHERMLLEIARNFADIPNERHQEALSALARALVDTH